MSQLGWSWSWGGLSVVRVRRALRVLALGSLPTFLPVRVTSLWKLVSNQAEAPF